MRSEASVALSLSHSSPLIFSFPFLGLIMIRPKTDIYLLLTAHCLRTINLLYKPLSQSRVYIERDKIKVNLLSLHNSFLFIYILLRFCGSFFGIIICFYVHLLLFCFLPLPFTCVSSLFLAFSFSTFRNQKCSKVFCFGLSTDLVNLTFLFNLFILQLFCLFYFILRINHQQLNIAHFCVYFSKVILWYSFLLP